jgi:hypothetical protein
MPRSTKRHHRTTTKEISDGDERKYFPNGIASTILGLQYYWDEIANGGEPGLTPEQFCEDAKFSQTYLAVQNTYKRRKPVTDIAKAIHRLANQKINIDFTDMRAFAQYVGLPTGLFLLFSQCVSEESRAGSDRESAKQTALDLIRRIRRVVDCAEEYIRNRPDDRPLFRRDYDSSGHQYLADVGVLKSWSDAFNRSGN